MVKVAILGINYAPEPTGIAPYTTGLAEYLAAEGHEVLVLTGYPHYPSWRRSGRTVRFRSEEAVGAVRVRRLRHPVPRRPSWPRRALMECAFGLQLVTTCWDRPDVLICVTPPLLAATMAIFRARLTPSRPAIGILVQDLYSRGVAEVGAGFGATACTVRRIESLAARLSDGISVIHAGFAADISESLGVDRGRIREIRNWTHVEEPGVLSSAEFRHSHHWPGDEVIVLHAGNMGHKQGLENVVAAAALADEWELPVRFVLLGDGNQRQMLESLGAGVRRLEFISPVSDAEFPDALGAADVLLVNEQPGVAKMSVPSKLTSYFNSGKPILAAVDANGLTAAEIKASGAGVCIPGDRPDLLVEEALKLGTEIAFAKNLGEAGRRYCAELLTRGGALARYGQWVEDLASAREMNR